MPRRRRGGVSTSTPSGEMIIVMRLRSSDCARRSIAACELSGTVKRACAVAAVGTTAGTVTAGTGAGAAAGVDGSDAAPVMISSARGEPAGERTIVLRLRKGSMRLCAATASADIGNIVAAFSTASLSSSSSPSSTTLPSLSLTLALASTSPSGERRRKGAPQPGFAATAGLLSGVPACVWTCSFCSRSRRRCVVFHCARACCSLAVVSTPRSAWRIG